VSSAIQNLENLFFMGNDSLSGKQVGSKDSHRLHGVCAWIQSTCIS